VRAMAIARWFKLPIAEAPIGARLYTTPSSQI
jgi:hypothetical protein